MHGPDGKKCIVKMGKKKKNPQSGDWGKERKESDVAGIGYE